MNLSGESVSSGIVLFFPALDRFCSYFSPFYVIFRLQIPHTGEIALLISHIVGNLGVKVEERATGSDMALRAWDRYFSKCLFQLKGVFKLAF